MKKTTPPDADKEKGGELLKEYDFDYSQARPNRFASRPPSEQILVTLDPDIAAVFTTAEAVNKALRAFMSARPSEAAPTTSPEHPTKGS